MEKEIQKLESVIENTNYFSKGGSWGTILDDLDPKKVPPKYIGVEFKEMDHSQMRRFFLSSDREKFEMAYWAETLNSRRNSKYGFVAGIICTTVIFLLILSF